LFLSPQSMIPHPPIHSSDQAYSDLNKKTTLQPYKIIGIEGYLPAQPWGAPAAAAKLNLAALEDVPPFPSLQELDYEYDGWPESGNPFIERETPATPKPNPNEIMTLPVTIRSFSTVIADILKSEDKLCFISYSQMRSQKRKEWKLIRVDLKPSLQQHPRCLQDGRFLVEFFIEHHRDKTLDIRDRRYWLEYHRSNSKKHIAVDYHIIQPSQFSEKTADAKHLITYREWIQLNDASILIHGPFEFAKRNNRKTRDRVSEMDWRMLIDQKGLYDNDPPQIKQQWLHIDISQPREEQVKGNREVAERCQTFMFNLEFEDQTLRDFGG
jgi:hypothetical protein